jgi:hypothetical protein
MSDGISVQTDDDDFGASETATSSPVILDPDRRYYFDKTFQLKIFYWFLGTMLVVVIIETGFRLWMKDTIMGAVLPVVVPVFTFLLGMGSRSETN